MKILIVGDRFAADWAIKYKSILGWPNLLAEKFEVVNLAQAGVSEYKIYQQVLSVTNIKEFDLILVAHTSPYRITTRKHPVHFQDVLHRHADLIFGDIEYHSTRLRNLFDRSLKAAKNFFVYHYDEKFQETIYQLLRNQINLLIGTTKCIIIDTPCVPEKFVTESNIIGIKEIVEEHQGLANHLSFQGNLTVYNKILNKINEFN
jgi:uncharacterized protein YutD